MALLALRLKTFSYVQFFFPRPIIPNGIGLYSSQTVTKIIKPCRDLDPINKLKISFFWHKFLQIKTQIITHYINTDRESGVSHIN